MLYIRTALFLFLFGISVSFSQDTVYSKKDIARFINKADQYLREMKFRESISYSREALKQAIFLKDDYLISKAYNTIAGNFDELSEFDQSILCYEKAVEHAALVQNDTLLSILNNNLGNVYFFRKKEYDKGISFYKKALFFADKTHEVRRLILVNLNIAWAYFDIGKYAMGKSNLDFINKHQSEQGDPKNAAILNMLNGMYYANSGLPDKADLYFIESIKNAKNDKQSDDLEYCYEEYSKFLFDIHDYKKAYTYFALHDKIEDENFNAEKLKKAAIEGTNLEIDEYKRALTKIETEKKIQQIQIQKSKTILLLFVVGMIVLLILLYTLYRNYGFKKKMNLELSKANVDLQAAKNKAEEASRLKSQFVSTISHELRTPLYGVVGITNMILDEYKELAGSAHLNSLKFSAKYLLALVNDILQINKIEENRLVLETLTFNIPDEINTIMNSLQFIASRNNNQLIAELDSDIAEFVIGDKLRLSQIFMNLVSNALKFTKNGEVVISAHLERVEDKMHFIKFEVRDNGIGIASADQDKIFEKFVQIERKNDDYQGTGLGLSIVKRLIAIFESEIYIESKENVGTTFTFTIGFEVDHKKSMEIINSMTVDLSSGQIYSVLIVEDNKINQMVTRKIIENNDFTCKVVDDGYSALEILKTNTFDAILMDINMPGLNGFQTTRKIREMGIAIPIIALTAFAKEEITEDAISSGMNDIITKPFEPATLFRVIINQVSKAKVSV